MATLYYNAAVDTDWQTLGNWWTDDAFTTQASALPSSGDDVVMSANCDINSSSEPTVVNLTVSGSFSFGIALTVTGMATFNDSSYNGGIVTGDATFNDNSHNTNYVNGGATFNDSSYNNYYNPTGQPFGIATVGSATFNDSSFNIGTVTGDATFNDSSYSSGDVNASATFNDSSYNSGYVGFDATFSGTAVNRRGISGAVILAYEKGINGSSILGIL